MMKITNGRLSGARQVACPNWDERPGTGVDLIVIHNISLPAGHFGNRYVEQLFCNDLATSEHPDFGELENVRVSSHLLIRRDGEVLQFVPFDKRAWHAGVSCHKGRENCNDFSIGIELEGTDDSGYCEVQYRVLSEILRELANVYDVSPEDIVGHCDIAPDRKTDPGPAFDWNRLAELMGARG